MSNNISNNVGRTAGRRYSADDASFDHASYADYHEYLQSMWPDNNRHTDVSYSHTQSQLRAKKWKVVDIYRKPGQPVPQPTTKSEVLHNRVMRSRWDEQMARAKSLITQEQLDELIDAQDEAKRSDII